MALTRRDAERLYRLMGPRRIERRARRLSPDGDPVLGAWAAYRELRGLVRREARRIARRDGTPVAGLGVALALRAMGYLGHFQPVAPLEATDWRLAAPDVLGPEIGIPGGAWVRVGASKPASVNLAVLRTLSEALLRLPDLNRARLRGRIYTRTSAEVMVHLAPRPDVVRSIVVNPSRWGPDCSVWNRRWRRAMRGMLRLEGHELQPLATRLLRAWCRAGFLASPAGAMLSPVGDAGIEMGWGPLVPGNGIPLAVTVCRPREGWAFIGVRPDHRVFDAGHVGPLYRYLQEEVPRCPILSRKAQAPSSASWSERPSTTRVGSSPATGSTAAV